jgi:uncharacterized YccA/Bax inhibitor family protein
MGRSPRLRRTDRSIFLMADPFRTSNPVLNEKAFRDVVATGEAMTLHGTVNKTGFLLLCAVVTAAWTWGKAHSGAPEAAMPWIFGGMIGGFVVALITAFQAQWSPILAPIYALLEGLALGGISAYFEHRYPGVAIQAVGLTFGTLFVMLVAYKTAFIRVTERLKIGVIAATGGIVLLYLLEGVLSIFVPIQNFAINGSGVIGIAFSIFVVAIAALNLVLDFDMIKSAVAIGAPKYMEWYGAFGMMVTLVWLYLAVLRLLGKGRRN